jgi:hypothetical protein
MNFRLMLWCLPVFVYLLSLGGAYLFLIRCYEFEDYPSIIEQQGDSGIYGSGLRSDQLVYKIELLKHRSDEVDVVAVGSSRSGPFRREHFTSSFINLAVAPLDAQHFYWLAQHALEEKKPKILIACFDFWWTNSNFMETYKFVQPNLDQNRHVSIANLHEVFHYLRKGELSFTDVFNLRHQPGKVVGLHAITRGRGCAPDGSFRSIPPHNDIIKNGLIRELIAAHAGQKRFQPSQSLQSVHLQQLNRFLAFLKKKGTPTIFLFPPVHPEAAKILQSHDHSHFRKLKNHLQSRCPQNVQILDASDASLYQADDMEFSDLIHGNEKAYARMLLWASHQITGLDHHLDLTYLKEKIKPSF